MKSLECVKYIRIQFFRKFFVIFLHFVDLNEILGLWSVNSNRHVFIIAFGKPPVAIIYIVGVPFFVLVHTAGFGCIFSTFLKSIDISNNRFKTGDIKNSCKQTDKLNTEVDPRTGEPEERNWLADGEVLTSPNLNSVNSKGLGNVPVCINLCTFLILSFELWVEVTWSTSMTD